ncbi:MAG: ComF family protein [Candidatus Nealsonbacteria bacterium]|nr:ComF family protein [Candidatus Nealsonbacteria bacterium]
MPEIVSVWEYEGIIEKAIHKIKYSGCYDIIDELMEKAMKKIELNLPEDTVITYVPMWSKKERQRGFNQSELIARKLEALLPRRKQRIASSEEAILEKVKDNRSQVGLGPKERAENVKGVFRMRREREARLPAGSLASTDARNVLLVDDVYTTGATMGECMKVLKKAGVKNVWGFTLARKLSL